MMKKYVNILGFKVEIKLIKKDLGEGKISWYCAYVLLPKSRFLSDNCLDTMCTFRGTNYEDEDDDLVGADSNHWCHSGESLDKRLMDVLRYIEEIIINYQKAVDKRYWGGSIVEGTNN